MFEAKTACILGSCFVPKPKVDAAVVQFVPRVEPLIKSSFKVILAFETGLTVQQ